jgi:hypothetical protein
MMGKTHQRTLLQTKGIGTYTSGYDKGMIADNAKSMMNAFPSLSAVPQICVLINQKWKE